METIYDFDPRNLPDRLKIAIGLAITSFAQTEQFIQHAIAGCCGIDVEYGKAITLHMSMPLRFSVLRSVAEIRIDSLDVLDELDRHLTVLEQCIKKRNDLAHRQWCRHPQTGDLFVIKEAARNRLESDLLAVRVEDVERDAVFIYEAGIDFYVFLVDQNLMPPLPPAYRPRGHKSKAARKNRSKTK